jgi:hypothetical protein
MSSPEPRSGAKGYRGVLRSLTLTKDSPMCSFRAGIRTESLSMSSQSLDVSSKPSSEFFGILREAARLLKGSPELGGRLKVCLRVRQSAEVG